jgi:hypothetical protein
MAAGLFRLPIGIDFDSCLLISGSSVEYTKRGIRNMRRR